MRVAPLILLALAAPAPAVAAPLGEVPFARIGSVLSFCSGATGAPGELFTPARLAHAAPTGLTPGERLPFGKPLHDCPAGATSPGGTTVLATAIQVHGSGQVAYAVRPPGGQLGAPTTVPGGSAQEVSAAVDDRGDVALAWLSARDDGWTVRAQSGAGPQTVADTGATQPLSLRVGITAGGEAIAMWSLPAGQGQAVNVAIAPPGGPFGTPQTVGMVSAFSVPALAVAADGRALVALPRLDALQVSQRLPGGAFGAPVTVAAVSDPEAVRAAAALDASGAAAVAWKGIADGQAGVALGTVPGTFSAHVLDARAKRPGDPFFDSPPYFAEISQPAEYGHRGDPSVALTPGGAQVAWAARAEQAGIRYTAVKVATTGAPTQTLGTGLRDVRTVAQFPGGVAWTDNRVPAGRDRLHAALAGGTARDGPMPRVTVRGPVKRRLSRDDELGLRVHCSAACEVRGQGVVGDGGLVLAKAGNGRLTISAGLRKLAPAHTAERFVRLLYGAPGARHPRWKLVRVRLAGVPAPRTPRVSRLRATRSGQNVTVTWRADRTSADATYWVSAGPVAQARSARGHSFRVRLTTSATSIDLYTVNEATGRTRRMTVVVP